MVNQLPNRFSGQLRIIGLGLREPREVSFAAHDVLVVDRSLAKQTNDVSGNATETSKSYDVRGNAGGLALDQEKRATVFVVVGWDSLCFKLSRSSQLLRE